MAAGEEASQAACPMSAGVRPETHHGPTVGGWKLPLRRWCQKQRDPECHHAAHTAVLSLIHPHAL